MRRKGKQMNNIKAYKTDFAKISETINDIAKTENTYKIETPSDIPLDVNRYSEYGFSCLGRKIGFPADFVGTMFISNPALAREIIADRAAMHFKQKNPSFTVREFGGKICGCVSNDYNYFDDKQIADIIGNSSISDMPFKFTYITPERLHLRAIDKDNPFKVDGDDSELYFCYFIDNSMVGLSSFKIQFGIYRKACTNGLILPVKEFVIVKQIHRGRIDIAAEFERSIALLSEKRSNIIEMLQNLTLTTANILEMQEEHRVDFLARKLLISKKETAKVLELFERYGGKTKWDMTNAITEFARDASNIEKRVFIEKKALLAA